MMANEAELLAGEQALATYANEEALEYFERGLEVKERQRVDAQTAALLFGLDRTQIATMERHNMQDAIASLSRAFDYYAETGMWTVPLPWRSHQFSPRF